MSADTPPRQQHQHRHQEYSDDCIACVFAWPQLDPQAKLGWWFLPQRAGHKPGTVRVHTSDICVAQGVQSVERSGRKALSALSDGEDGLLRIVEKHGATWTVELVDPIALRERKLRVANLDPQPQLFDGQTAAEPEAEDDAAAVKSPSGGMGASEGARAHESELPTPAEDALLGASDCTRAHPTCNTNNNHYDRQSNLRASVLPSQDKSVGASAVNRAHSATPSTKRNLPSREEQLAKQHDQRAAEHAARNADPPTIRDALMEMAQHKKRSFGEDVSALETEIRSVVADDTLYPAIIARVARAAATNDGVFEDLQKLLGAIKEKFGTEPDRAKDRGKYFNKSASRLLEKHGERRSESRSGQDEMPI